MPVIHGIIPPLLSSTSPCGKACRISYLNYTVYFVIFQGALRYKLWLSRSVIPWCFTPSSLQFQNCIKYSAPWIQRKRSLSYGSLVRFWISFAPRAPIAKALSFLYYPQKASQMPHFFCNLVFHLSFRSHLLLSFTLSQNNNMRLL